MEKAITFVIPVYKKPYALAGILSSLHAQTDPRWKAICVFDGDDKDTLDNARIAEHLLIDERVKICFRPYEGQWGHPAREYGLSLVDTEYVVLTGHDNYYLPIFVGAVLGHYEKEWSLAFCDFLHLGDVNHPAGGYRYFPSWIAYSMIDMGSVVVPTWIAKEVGFGEEFRDHGADFKWFNTIKNKYYHQNLLATKIGAGNILYIHN